MCISSTSITSISTQSLSPFEIKRNKNTCIINKVLLYGHSEKHFEGILFHEEIYSLLCRSKLMKTINNRYNVKKNRFAVEQTG